MKKFFRNRRRKKSPSEGREKTEAFFSPKRDHRPSQEAEFFQPKLEISPVNSPAEKEADQAADKIVSRSSDQLNRSKEGEGPLIHRQAEEEEIQSKLEVQRQAEEEEAQAKLDIQRQADEEKLQSKLEVQRQAEEEEPQAKLEIQRKGQEEEEMAPKLDIQRQAEEEEPQAKKESNSSPKEYLKTRKKDPSSELEGIIQQTKGWGFALPDDVRQKMEAQFEADFTEVRIHTDSKAIQMCRMIQAQAFTHGYDIYFNQGKYNPDTQRGRHLLAHELTHVVQQKGKQ